MSPLQSVRILELFCERICYLHYSLRTEEAHVYWPISFIRCHSLRHPGEMGKVDRGVPDGVGEQAQCLIVYAPAGIVVAAVFALDLTLDISGLPLASPLDERVRPLRHRCSSSADGNSRRAC